jgi:hypothetical protein
LDLDFAAHSGKKQWPIILSRAIVARAVPGDTPVKRKSRSRKSNPPSSRAEKPGAKSTVELEDDDVEQVHASEEDDDPWTSAPFPPRKKPAKNDKSGKGTKKSTAAAT